MVLGVLGWYRNLKEPLSGDNSTLERRGARPWWRVVALAAG